ncbi:MAG: hypothetical protein AAFO62_12270 [Pseudomonadota bacterium]
MTDDRDLTAQINAGIAAARDGDWETAHTIAQAHEGDTNADWLHAIVHLIEGDEGNARYWFRRAGRAPVSREAHAGELDALASQLGGER